MLQNVSMQKKRTFDILRKKMLRALKGQKTVNQLASDTGINWKTVDRHLVYLIGKGFVIIIFESPYVKIYELSEKGKEEAKKK